MPKSHVSMERVICVVCGKPYDTGAILLDRRLRDSMEPQTVTGYGMCPEHEDLRAKGYVALVGIDPGKSKEARAHPGTINPEDAYRTGDIAHIRVAALPRIFNIPAPEKMVAFVELEVIEKLKGMTDAQG